MAAPRSVFTEFERKLVLALAKKNRHIIEKKETNKVWNAQKSLCWRDIEIEFNAVEGVRKRSAKQLKQCYENMKKRMKAKGCNGTLLTVRNENNRSDQALFQTAILELDVLNVPHNNNLDSDNCFVLPDNAFEGPKETVVDVVPEQNNDQVEEVDIKPTLATDGSIILTPAEEPQSGDKTTPIPPTNNSRTRCGFYKQSVWRRKEPISTARTSTAIEICTAKEDYYKEKLKLEREEHELRKCLLLEKIKFMQNLNASVEKHPEKNKFYISETL